MKFTWLSNAPHASTGYGNQTKLFIPRLKALGHEPAIIAFYGLEGGILEGEVPIFPKGGHPYGQDIAAAHTKSWGAEVILSLIDAWVCEPALMQKGGVKWVPWFPVDSEPLPPPVARAVSGAYRRIVFSKFGERMLSDAGLDCYYVPHGIDTKTFRPIDRMKARRDMGLPSDRFIVGMVAANKGYPPRKAFFENIAAFKKLKDKHPDAYLYIHTQAGAEQRAQYEINLAEYCQRIGLELGRDVLFPARYLLGLGFPDYAMVNLYNAFDVHLLVSMGEGFGIPQVEAQACGTPVIAGDWTASGELIFSGWTVERKDATPTWTLGGAYQFTPSVDAIADRLEQAYRMAGNEDYRKRARDGALAYDADKVTEKYWKPVLQDIEESLHAEPTIMAVPVGPANQPAVEGQVA
jgi:glycosyltransferase involved in cell wall biosynthesis